MTVTIPTRQDAGRYRFSVELAGAVYTLVLAFNRRDDHWYFTLLDNAGDPVRHGVRVTPNFPLLRQLIQQGRPEGVLLAIDPQGNLEPGLADLGGQVVLSFADGM